MRSRLYLRLLVVALLVLFLPVAGVWSLASFEKELLASEERGMGVQARTLAAWLAPPGTLDGERARTAVRAIERPLSGRVRIVDAAGATLVDTAGGTPESSTKLSGSGSSTVRDRALYRIGALLWRLRPAFTARPEGEGASDGSAIAAALAGNYGAVTRESADGASTVLTVAVPVRALPADIAGGAERGAPGDPAALATRVVGAVVVSRTTDTVLAALDRIRLDLFRIVLLSLAATILIVLLLARGIVRPLLRLRDAADRALRGRRESPSSIPETGRRDEIGELARALANLSDRLERRLDELESFATDLAHELRNPLAAMRSAADLLPDSATDEERRRLAGLIRTESVRIDRVVTSLQELARLDAERTVDGERGCDLGAVLERVAAVARNEGPAGVEIAVSAPTGIVSTIPEEAAERVVENLLANALSFSPTGGRVDAVLAQDAANPRLDVIDRGPGVPPEHRERIFDRFFTFREEPRGGGHLGLGLAIARTILERNGGSIELVDSATAARGACFRVHWPRPGAAEDRSHRPR
ncbi:MAG: ATP-binding protein [Thermoanaerobaculia bacterium]